MSFDMQPKGCLSTTEPQKQGENAWPRKRARRADQDRRWRRAGKFRDRRRNKGAHDLAERRELIAGAGTKQAEVAGAGVFKDAASDALVRQTYFSGEAAMMRLVIPGFGVMKGQFVVSELSYGGEHDGEAVFSVRLASAGAISFDAV
jgi:hypothetical protein